ncbi:MAG: FAD-binding oxidoreductase [Tatlockia sp.]|jgi:FAD/FMN-containing dehydrogenase
MQPTQWSTQKIQQCNKETGQALQSNEQVLAFYGQDFGKLFVSTPKAVSTPETIETIQALLSFANQNKLPVTLRGKGLSQGGQSLPVSGGLTLHLEHFNQVLAKESDCIWVEANTSFSDLLEVTLQTLQIPSVLPYNCNLSAGGVLSAGGMGASSFKYGPLCSQVKALEVILADGKVQVVDAQSPLFHACLAGQGQFGVISKACLRLRPCQKKVRTFFLVFLDQKQWLEALCALRPHADFIEAFCSPAIQGLRLAGEKRQAFAQWLFSIQVSFEYTNNPPQLQDMGGNITPWKVVHQQDEPIRSYLHRHDGRFDLMRLTGQWELFHPWYECFMTQKNLDDALSELLEVLPLHYATLLQVVPVANNRQTGFFMLPDEDAVFELMVLNPGVLPVFVKDCLETIRTLDARFLPHGGKRYLSGYLGADLPASWWQAHYGKAYPLWQKLKKEYDPHCIFGSRLHSKACDQ